jgi:hypothetical protein
VGRANRRHACLRVPWATGLAGRRQADLHGQSPVLAGLETGIVVVVVVVPYCPCSSPPPALFLPALPKAPPHLPYADTCSLRLVFLAFP